MARKQTYSEKRSFDLTPEPQPQAEGNVDPGTAAPGNFFMVHQHHATRLHFDLRLEMMNGDVPVLVSFAIPKNLPLKPKKPHLAIHVEDHPLEYGSFSGEIPAGQYGAGQVRIFDSGEYELLEQEPGKLSFRLAGQRLQGEWHLNRSSRGTNKEEWLAFLKTDLRAEPDPPPEPEPMLATLCEDAFDGADWIFEPKWDGVRTLAICSDETRLLSRRLNDVSATYPELQQIHRQLVAIDAIVDGEIVTLKTGKPSFQALQGRFNLQNPREIDRAARQHPVIFMAFDLLYLDGRSLIGEPIEVRKRELERSVVVDDRIKVPSAVPNEGIALARAAREQGLEGIVAKRLGSPYRPGRRSKDWLKVKVVHDADVVIGGWTPGDGARSTSFGALLVGAYEDDGLVFMGSVGTGFSDALLEETRALLDQIGSDDCPFVDDPTDGSAGPGKGLKQVAWCEPVVVARVEYRQLTEARRFRAPSFKGFRPDKSPDQCLLAEIAAEGSP